MRSNIFESMDFHLTLPIIQCEMNAALVARLPLSEVEQGGSCHSVIEIQRVASSVKAWSVNSRNLRMIIPRA